MRQEFLKYNLLDYFNSEKLANSKNIDIGESNVYKYW